jgi:hypothetical protein
MVTGNAALGAVDGALASPSPPAEELQPVTTVARRAIMIVAAIRGDLAQVRVVVERRFMREA